MYGRRTGPYSALMTSSPDFAGSRNAQAPADRRRPALSVLLVDDSAVFLTAAMDLLKELPAIARVAMARSGEEALAIVAVDRFDLVLLDYQLTGMSGLDTLRAIRSRATPKVAIVTLHDEAEFRGRVLEAGADGFVAKSDFAAELPLLVQRLFGPPREGARGTAEETGS